LDTENPAFVLEGAWIEFSYLYRLLEGGLDILFKMKEFLIFGALWYCPLVESEAVRKGAG